MERITVLERLIAGLSYLTYGWIGAIWFVIMYLMKKDVSMFLKYHIVQAVFLFFGLFVIQLLLGLLMQIFNVIPFLNVAARQAYYLLNMPVFMNYSVIQLFIYTLQLYLVITALMGLYSFIPKISDIISEITGRKYW